MSRWVWLLDLHLIKIQPQLTHIWAGLRIFDINLRETMAEQTFSMVVEHWPMVLKELG